MELRVKVLSSFFLLTFGLIILRLFYWQIIKGAELSQQAKNQYNNSQVLSATRGSILASDGSFLASGEEVFRVYADLNIFEANKVDTAESIAEIYLEDVEVKLSKNSREKVSEDKLREEMTDKQKDNILEQLNRTDVVWVPILAKVTRTQREKLDSLKIKGFVYEPYEVRQYPEGSSASHLLGFVGNDDAGQATGYFGLEGYYDLILSGKPGFLSREENVKGDPNLLGLNTQVSGTRGVSLKTHIDKRIQILIEEKLKEGIKKYSADSGSIVVMNPSTGAVLAMASMPDFSPGKFAEFSNDIFRNPIVSDSFEPGSIFKVLVMSAAIDAGVVEPDTQCDICSGPYQIDKYFIRTWNDQYNANATMTDVIVHSDNTGMVFASKRLGKEKLHEYLSRFGMGRPTGVDVQGEMVPALRDSSQWSEVDLATISFGQGIAVTPIQMIQAVSAIANDGVLVTPQVVDEIIGDNWTEDIKPKAGETVISSKSADKIAAMMVAAAKDGEAKWTHAKGFKVAGKTGTAQIPIAGHYDSEKTIASYIGFAPADDPKFIMLVTLREPESSPWASETAAPLWYDIAREMFLYYGIQPES